MKFSTSIAGLRVVPLALAVIGLLIPVGLAQLCRCAAPLAEKGCCGGSQGAEHAQCVSYCPLSPCCSRPCCGRCRLSQSQPTFARTDQNTTDLSIGTVAVNDLFAGLPKKQINGGVENPAESGFGSFLRLHALLGVWLN